jgi:fumarate hydratase subunit beta
MDKIMNRNIIIPDDIARLAELKAGDEVLLTGTIYSARDQAHTRMITMLKEGKELPIPLKNTLIFYMGPSPTKPGEIIGAAGPTTSGRMDSFTPPLLDLGLAGMIGKGPRSGDVIASIVKNHSIYFYAFGGCGALYAERIIESELAAFEDLGPEAIYRLSVKDFPLIVAIDGLGNSIF